MNIRELEGLLRETEKDIIDGHYATLAGTRMKFSEAIAWCRTQQRRTAKRKVEFKLRAAEQRELLR